jgi:hypothetical protein
MRLTIHEWKLRKSQHEVRVDTWVQSRQERKQRGERDPVDDFLFDYYPYSISKLRAWHPGYGVTLQGSAEDLREFLERSDYRATEDGCTLNVSGLGKLQPRRKLVRRILANTARRTAHLNCFGMHEWAMVYGKDQSGIRHESVPLRLSSEHIKQTVNAIGLRCTHIDAYRFFTDESRPLNTFTPTRDNQPELEQPGCLHANMDLYKYAMWFSPFTSSDLVADCFALARDARALDMQASPYELTSYGLAPIALEAPQGRREYVDRQSMLMERAAPLRERLSAALAALPD